MEEKKEYFTTALNALDEEIRRAIKISETRNGVQHTGRQLRVLDAFGKVMAHVLSIKMIADKSIETDDASFLDHYSLATLSRTVIDSSIMVHYLSEPKLNALEWEIRRNVIYLHDANNRKRFLRYAMKLVNFPPDEVSENLKEDDKQKIIGIIKNCGAELGYSSDKVNRLLSGQHVFIDGLRGAVREADLDLGQFEFSYTYLSNHVHSHPVSYIRAKQMALSFLKPSEFQYVLSGFCLETVCMHLHLVTKRIDLFTGHISRDPNGQID